MLAERFPAAQPQRVEEIAAAQNIPENYLRRLLIELKRGGLVTSQKGPNGGYALARHPGRITMAEVVHIIEGDYAPVECLEEGSAGALCQPGDGCTMREVWQEVRNNVTATLARTTLQSLTERRKKAIHFQI
jgi:Rrf2 family protein